MGPGPWLDYPLSSVAMATLAFPGQDAALLMSNVTTAPMPRSLLASQRCIYIYILLLFVLFFPSPYFLRQICIPVH